MSCSTQLTISVFQVKKGIKMKKRIFPICFMVVSCFLIGACKSGRPDSQKVDLTSVPLATIIQNAQEEGIIESVGMPANWANWNASWFCVGS